MELLLDFPALLLTFVSLALSVLWYIRSSWRYKLPPGPIGVPLLGMLPYLDSRDPAADALRLSKKYGKVFGGNLGSYRAVFLNDYETIKEAFTRTDDALNDRPRISSLELYSDGRGVACCFYENHWKEQRRFALKTLRNFGMGRPQGYIRDATTSEASHLLEKLETMKGPFDPTVLTGMAICNVTCNLVFGRRFDYDEKEFEDFVHALAVVFELADTAGIVNYLRWMKYIPFSGYYALGDAARHLETGLFIKESIAHKKTFDPSSEPRDLIDAFLLEMHKKKKELEETGRSPATTGFNDKQLIHMISDIFAAGTDTTTSSTKWTWLHCIKFDEEQRKVQEELDRVVGRNRLPTLEDRPDLIYTQAFLAESIRCGCIASFGVPHGAKEDTKFCGYDIPKGTVVLPNLHAVVHDPAIFPDPDRFYPPRYIDENGKLITSLVERTNCQFGIGRRQCLGMDMAHMERFSLVTNVLHRFTLSAPNGPDSVTLEGAGGMTRNPAPYKLIVKAR